MAKQSNNATAVAYPHPDIVKRTSLSGLIISGVMILAGILVFFATFHLEDKGSALGMGLMVLGSGLFLGGVFRLFWKSKQLVYLPTGSVTKAESYFFDLKNMDKLKGMVNSGTFTGDTNLKCEASGNLRLDVMISEDKQFAAVQLFQFVPYVYNTVTPVQYFTNGEASDVAAFLLKCKHP